MGHALTRELTLKALRERRERLLLEFAMLEGETAARLSAREVLTWRTWLAELDARIARWSHD
ncbi:MAG: hypothetical protein Q8R02_08410 [Hyphomonadaceae bacterium]|nr:hypothetical protein [Hyphomonadaceae bacterium]